MIFGIKILIAAFLGLLIVIGGCYITFYEKAPFHERVHILCVGLGIYIGIGLILCGT